jgi:hypothetical protein
MRRPVSGLVSKQVLVWIGAFKCETIEYSLPPVPLYAPVVSVRERSRRFELR